MHNGHHHSEWHVCTQASAAIGVCYTSPPLYWNHYDGPLITICPTILCLVIVKLHYFISMLLSIDIALLLHYLKNLGNTLPRLLLCSHLILLLLLAPHGIAFILWIRSPIINYSSYLKRRTANDLHFVCTKKYCCLRATITNKMLFSIFFLYIFKNIVITNVLRISQ